MGIRLPNLEDLQAVVDLVTGGNVDYRTLPNEVRLQIVDIAVRADMNDSLALLTELNDRLEQLPVSLAECEPIMTLGARLTEIAKSLNDISVDTDSIESWFKLSKPLDSYLFDGIGK